MLQGTLFNALSLHPHSLLRTIAGTGAMSTFSMTALNNCWAGRFRALDTRDVKSVWINWSVVTAGGTVELRIETVDGATLKPTGTLYDANATKTFTPAAGWQQVTFATLPTAGLTAGTLYAVVLITTVAGTTHTLRSHMVASINGWAPGPGGTLTAADGSTRSNLTETVSAAPCFTLLMEDDADEILQACPFATLTSFGVYGTRACGSKITLASSVKVDGIIVDYAAIGTKANVTADLILDIRDSGNNIVAGSSITIDKDYFSADFASRQVMGLFASPITLAAGTYRVIARNADTATASTAAFNISTIAARASGVVPQSFIRTDTTDITVGSPAWTDTNTDVSSIGLSLSDQVAGGGTTIAGTPMMRGMVA